MRVLIADSVFNGPEQHLSEAEHALRMLELFGLALEGRHRVQLEDRAAYERWRARRDEDVAAGCDLAIERSDEAEVRLPSSREIRIDTGPPRWDDDPPTLPLATAISVLREKFKLVLEDRENDLGFLRAVMQLPERDELDARAPWWEVIHGGGLAPMVRTLRGLADQPGAALYHFVVFDSDARRPFVRSAEAELLAGAFGDEIEHHCLARRAVENYATRNVLDRWALVRSSDAGANDRVEAFFRMPTPQCRHHFNMKKGLRGDEKTDGGIEPGLFETLSNGDREVLGQGFGGLRKVLIEPGAIRTSDLIADGSFDELNRMVLRILRTMR